MISAVPAPLAVPARLSSARSLLTLCPGEWVNLCYRRINNGDILLATPLGPCVRLYKIFFRVEAPRRVRFALRSLWIAPARADGAMLSQVRAQVLPQGFTGGSKVFPGAGS